MDLLPLLQAIGTLLVLALLMGNLRNNKNSIRKGPKAPEPRGAWPIIGHLHLLGGQTPVFRTLAAMADKHGPIFTIRLGLRRAIVVSSRDTIMECFTTNDRAFLTRPKSAALKYMGYNDALFGFGPFGKCWRELRKITTLELLSNRHLESLKHVRSSEVDSCIKELYSLCIKNGTGATKADMTRWFRLVTMNLMLRAIAGKRYNCLGYDDENDAEPRRFARAMDKFMYLSGVFEVSDVIPHIGWMDLQGNVRNMKRNAEEMDHFLSKWLEEHIQSRQNGVMKEERDFMDVMLSLFPEDDSVHGHESKDLIKATALTLILGGSDTTTAAMTWALSLLLNHGEVLKTVQEELDTHVGRERWVEESDTNNLVYLRAIVKETLRLYPSGPLSIPREAMEDCHVAGYYVPKGTRLIVNLWKLHRDPRAWTNPCEFKPERFLSSHAKVEVRGQQFEYLPFSSGRRSCPGITAALQMMQLTLARLLQSFNFATVSMNAQVDMSEGLGLSLPKATPLEVMLTPRLPHNLYLQLMDGEIKN